MKRLLALSLLLNLLFLILLGLAYRRLGGKTLPSRPPDFSMIQQSLSTHLSQPDYASVLKLDSFESKKWLCRSKLVYQVTNFQPHWQQLQALVRSVSHECSVPGRIAGSYLDPSDPSRIIGATVEFGYSPEVGYRHPNEFYQE